MALRLLLSNEPALTFLQFWNAYPRKVAKKDALKAWIVLDPDAAVIAEILAALEWQRKLWGDLQFVPHPATYLRSERWTDERPAPVKPNPRSSAVPLAHGVSDQLAANRKIQDLIRGGMDQATAIRQVSVEMGWSQLEE